MATAFPDPNQSPWTNPDSGKEYEYIDGVWQPKGGGSSGGGGGSVAINVSYLFFKLAKANFFEYEVQVPDLNGRTFDKMHLYGDIKAGFMPVWGVVLNPDSTIQKRVNSYVRGTIGETSMKCGFAIKDAGNAMKDGEIMYLAINPEATIHYLSDSDIFKSIAASENIPL